MVSEIDRTKRALVALLTSLAVAYGVALQIARDAPDADVQTALKKVSRKLRGSSQEQTRLNAARDAWQHALQSRGGRGRPPGSGAAGSSTGQGLAPLAATRRERKADERGFRVQSHGVLLTYQKFPDTGVWARFLAFLDELLAKPGLVRYWCATLETNADGTYHLHLMLQFFAPAERTSQEFAFEGVCPNARPNDLLGEGCLYRGLGDWTLNV